jgi:N utilization substance protein A
MAKRKKVQTKQKQMFIDLDRVLDQVSKDKGVPREALVDTIETAFLTAAKKKWGQEAEIEAQYNEETGEIELFQFKTVVDDIVDPTIEMTMDEAKKLDPEAEIGDSLGMKMDATGFGRIAAQTAKQVIIQKVREAERNIVYEEFKDRLGELITGIVRRFERGNMIIDLGRTEAIIPREEQVPSENYRAGERVQGFFLQLDREGRGPAVVLSRKNVGLLIQLFTMEVPEIAESIVTIQAAAREPGVRSKIAVSSRDSDVDPVGACVGIKGSRVQSVVSELKGEKIDIVAWDLDPARFVCNAIAPAEVVKVIIREQEHAMEVVVPDDQLSLAIGRRGQNVRLAAQLTGWNIDVFSETRIEQLAGRARRVLSQVLGIDDGTAIVLYSHSFRNFEDIAGAELTDFQQVPGIGMDTLAEIYGKARKAVADGVSTDELLNEIIAEEEAKRAAEEAARKEEEAKLAAEAAASEKEKEESAGSEEEKTEPQIEGEEETIPVDEAAEAASPAEDEKAE